MNVVNNWFPPSLLLLSAHLKTVSLARLSLLESKHHHFPPSFLVGHGGGGGVNLWSSLFFSSRLSPSGSSLSWNGMSNTEHSILVEALQTQGMAEELFFKVHTLDCKTNE